VSSSSKPEVPAIPPAKSAPAVPPAQSALPQLRGRGFRRGNMIGANFGSALEALWVNRLRSLLTALGIFIGVAAVIAALTLTQGVGAAINDRISSVGVNTIFLRNGTANERGAFGAGGTVQSLTVADADAIRKQVAHVSYVSPVVSTSEQLVFGSENENTGVQGVSTDYQTIENWTIAEGAWFSATDQSAGKPVAVIGDTVKQNLFNPTGTDPVNKTIRIGNQLFQVIGVLQAKGSGGFASADDVVYTPYTTALDRLKNSTYVDQILASTDSSDTVIQAQSDITILLEQRHHIGKGSVDDFRSESSAELLQTANQIVATITLLLVGIASISLTVGGIGIMNIMLVSVTERTREIGIRMSIGARRGDIRNQFLIEALTLSLVGGAIGMALGLLVGYFVTKVATLPFVVSPTSILMPFLVSAAIGVAFGLYPAIRASRLDPIVALRSE
jgi:putative ABC transport system permease protein